jgi:hypothetical protein
VRSQVRLGANVELFLLGTARLVAAVFGGEPTLTGAELPAVRVGRSSCRREFVGAVLLGISLSSRSACRPVPQTLPGLTRFVATPDRSAACARVSG